MGDSREDDCLYQEDHYAHLPDAVSDVILACRLGLCQTEESETLS